MWTCSTTAHNQLLCIADVEGEVVVLAPHCNVSNVIGDQAYHFVLSANLMMLLELSSPPAGQPIRKSRIQLQREMFNPRVLMFSDELGGHYRVEH